LEKREFKVSEEYPKIILTCIPAQKLEGTVSDSYPLQGLGIIGIERSAYLTGSYAFSFN
jgi:hypothetical protein